MTAHPVPVHAPAPPAAANPTDIDRPGRRRPSRAAVAVVIAVVLVAAFGLRWLFVDRVNSDLTVFVRPWYERSSTGGFAALTGEYANYNPPYLYLLSLVSRLGLPDLVAIKLLSAVFDVLLAAFAGLLVALVRPRSWWPVATFAVVMFAPTVVVNSAVWGQCDSIYATFCLGSLYLALRRRPWWAAVLFGVAFSFKLQAVFLLPALGMVLILTRQKVWALLASVGTFAVMLVPAWLAGRGWSSLLSVYPTQITGGGTGGFGAGTGGFGAGTGTRPQGTGTGTGDMTAPSGTGTGGTGTGGTPPTGGRAGGFTGGGATTASGTGGLSKNAPTVFQWLRSSSVEKYLGVAASALAAAGLGLLAWVRRARMDVPGLLLLSTVMVIAVPFLLPEMHERYFYLADVLSIVAAFTVGRRTGWTITAAVLVTLASLGSYAPFLLGNTLLPLGLLSLFMLVAGAILLAVLVERLGDQAAGAAAEHAPAGHAPVDPPSADPAPAGASTVVTP